MTQISPRILCVHKSFAVGVNRAEVILPLLVLHVHNAFRGKNHAVSPIACRHHAVEHIHAARDALQDVGRRAYAHQVTRPVFRQDGVDQLDHLIHFLGRLAHSQSADGVAFGILRGDVFRRLLSQVTIDATLHDGKQHLMVAILGFSLPVAFHTAVQPAVGALHRLLGVGVIRRSWRTLVESHHDVGADATLDVHHPFGGE